MLKTQKNKDHFNLILRNQQFNIKSEVDIFKKDKTESKSGRRGYPSLGSVSKFKTGFKTK